MNGPFVSVIIPTYRDWKRLAICLDALAKQTYQQEQFEVLVVNNDPDDVPPIDLSLAPNVQILSEAKCGSYAARNCALNVAAGTVIAFTDADCIPDVNWLLNAVAYLNTHPYCSRIAGHVSIFYEGDRPTTAELYNSVFSFPQRSHALYAGTSVTANMITYKRVFDAVGLFDDNLLSLGDLQWGKRAHEAGFQIQFVDSVVVSHPARSMNELIQKEKRVGGGQATMARRHRLYNFLAYIYDNRPRLYTFRQLYRYSQHLNLVEKLRVLFLRHYLMNIRAAEKLRVLLGKQPSRA